jgi:hypothetical protein
MNQPVSHVSATRLVLFANSFLGTTTSIGIVLGWTGTGSHGPMSSLALLACGLSASHFITRKHSTSTERSESTEKSVVLLPLLFLLLSGRWLLRPVGSRLSWLASTWDGTTNPGVVTYSFLKGSIGRDFSSISQWQSYPQAPHFLLGQVQNLAEILGTQSASSRATIYALGLWTTYALLILSVGVLAQELLHSVESSSRLISIAVPTIQMPLILPWFLERTVFLHSLSLLTSLIASTAMITQWLHMRSQPVTRWRELVVFALCTTAVIESFPLLLPIPIVIWILTLLDLRRRQLENSGRSAVIVCLLLAVAAPRILLQAQQNAANSHVSIGGHILAIPTPLVYLAAAFVLFSSVRLASSKTFAASRSLVTIILSIASVPLLTWIQVGNFDRTYGVNYYPKKCEYAAFVVLLGFVPLILLGNEKLRRVNPMKSWTCVMITITCLFGAYFGPLRLPRMPNPNSSIARLTSEALNEASLPSESLIISEDTPASILASMLSNQLNTRTWSLGYVNDHLTSLYQQLSVRLNVDSDAELCALLSDSSGSILRLSETDVSREKCRR